MSWIWSFYFIGLFFSLAAKLIGVRTGRQFFKNVDFLDLHPLKDAVVKGVESCLMFTDDTKLVSETGE